MLSDQKPIAFFIPNLAGAGAQRVIVNLANSLVDITTHPVHVVLVRSDGIFLQLLRPEVVVVDLNKKRSLFSIHRLTKYLKLHQPVVLMSRMNYANVIATIGWLLAGRSSMLVLSEATIVKPHHRRRLAQLQGILLRWLMRRTYKLADLVVANSEGTAESLISTGVITRDKLVTISNPVLPRNRLTTSEAFVRLTTPEANHSYICAIGRLEFAKGFDILLEAFSKLGDKSMELIILGEGPLRSELEGQAEVLGISKRVKLAGFFLDPTEVLARSRLFVLSSRWEGFGNVLVEALALGVPIVSTDCPGAPKSILLDGALGHLVQVDDASALREAIEHALVSPRGNPQERMARASDFYAPTIAKQYLDAFRI